MRFNWTAIHEDTGEEFGSTVEAEVDGNDYRPVFIAARELAEQSYPQRNFRVTGISFTS